MGGGSNRRQGGQPTPKYLNQKTPDFGHFILESGGGGERPGFQKCGGQDPPPPPTPPVGDALAAAVAKTGAAADGPATGVMNHCVYGVLVHVPRLVFSS